MTTLLRAPLVGYGYLVDRLRRLPIAGFVLRHTSFVAGTLMAGAVLAFVVWAGTAVPQRIGLGDLVTGQLSHMQSWIILSGDLTATTSSSTGYRYVLTDPSVPNAVMNVFSDVELQVGRTTISGTYTGPREPAPVGFRWIGTMHTDDVLAAEIGPPLLSLVLVSTALLLLLAARVSYPMFFAQRSRNAAARMTTMQIGLRRGPLTEDGQTIRGSLILEPGEAVRLKVSGAETELLRLDSVHTGADVGELRHLASSSPPFECGAQPMKRPLPSLHQLSATRHTAPSSLTWSSGRALE